MSKQNNIYKGHLDYQSEFDHKLACWATNHRDWTGLTAGPFFFFLDLSVVRTC